MAARSVEASSASVSLCWRSTPRSLIPCSRMSDLISVAVSAQVAASAASPVMFASRDVREPRCAFEADPAHELRRHVVPRVAARLPDALIRLTPHCCCALGLRLHERPQAPRNTPAAPAVQQDRVECRAVDVVLPLVEGAVADADRSRRRKRSDRVAERLQRVVGADIAGGGDPCLRSAARVRSHLLSARPARRTAPRRRPRH